MSSVVDVVNLALSHIGDSATVSSIDPPEGSAQATHCARYYPMARDALLEMHDWNFATRRAELALLSDDPAFGYEFAYAAPNDCLKIRQIVHPDAPDDPQDYVTEDDGTNRAIYTDQEDAACLYTVRVTNSGKFPPLFVQALSHLLASHLAGPVIKGDAGKAEAKAQMQTFLYWFGKACEADASQRKTDQNATNSLRHFTPSSIAAR